MSGTLLCTVRGCRLPLTREARRAICAQGHSFDIAQSGYLNLLQPQERRSKRPGDTAAAIAGRRRLHDCGLTTPLLRAMADMLAAGPSDSVLDAGCGDGFYLGAMAQESGFAGHGIDISIPAVEAAARRYPACDWIVANADRFVPYADRTFSIVLSITGRLNPDEFRRVLGAGGRLLIALAAPEDLIELRGVGRDRVARTVATFAKDFILVEQRRATTRAHLDAAALQDVLHAIYRPRLARAVESMQVTFSLDLLLFSARPPGAACAPIPASLPGGRALSPRHPAPHS